jgi:hypothetical protein
VTTTTSDLNASNNTGQVTTTPQGQVYDPNNDDHDKDDEKPKETEQQRHERNRTNASSPDDERIEGNVISTNCADAWPYLTIANRDGEVEVRLVKDAKKYCDNIQVGDYFDATGQKIHELLFYAEDFTLHRGGRKVQ